MSGPEAQTRAFNDYDSWCDVVGTTAGLHYGDVPHSKLSEWYRSGVSIRGAVTLAHEYILGKQK